MSRTRATKTSVYNSVMAELGSTDTAVNLDTPQNQAQRRFNILWPDIIEDVLAQHPFNAAVRRAMLNEAADPPAFGWSRRYQLPADCIRWLPPEQGSPEYFRGEQEGDFLLTDRAGPLPVRYIAFVEDLSVWPRTVVRTLIFAMAASLAESVTQSESIKNGMLEREERQLRRAKRLDGLATGKRRRGGVQLKSEWLTARRVGRYTDGR